MSKLIIAALPSPLPEERRFLLVGGVAGPDAWCQIAILKTGKKHGPFPSLFILGTALHAMELRCKVTGNPCGTDTWGVGADGKIIPCECESCTEYMRRRSPASCQPREQPGASRRDSCQGSARWETTRRDVASRARLGGAG